MKLDFYCCFNSFVSNGKGHLQHLMLKNEHSYIRRCVLNDVHLSCCFSWVFTPEATNMAHLITMNLQGSKFFASQCTSDGEGLLEASRRGFPAGLDIVEDA